ncbi:B3 domain-containing transcription factor ABI3-like [Wolffia australiana]
MPLEGARRLPILPHGTFPVKEWKAEKNLRFLLQKVLKQSDVGSLGRIVLPKKEAETHLPELQTRDGMTLVMEDIVTSQIWNMRYRFWPNNKSKMYLLENTGEFLRLNGLQEGDFIIIYSDIKCGKYMIRGVKVRQTTDCIQSGNNSFKLNPMDAEVKRDGGH